MTAWFKRRPRDHAAHPADKKINETRSLLCINTFIATTELDEIGKE